MPGPISYDSPHVPVMLRECIEYLNVRPDGLYADVTSGLGGHTGAIARLLTTGKVFAFDRDAESLVLAKAATLDCAERIQFLHQRFSLVGETLEGERIPQLDGFLADLGVSRHQLTEGERGFSLMADGPLDMRQDRSADRAQWPTAADLVNYESEKQLADLIYKWGEERRSRQIARAIVRARPIASTGELATLIEKVVSRTGKLHPATQTFMALRLVVNREMEELDALLASLPKIVKPGGRAVFLTFMSLEDRKVKQSFQGLAKEGRVKILTRHVIRPSEEEVERNPPSRSAKLRAVEML